MIRSLLSKAWSALRSLQADTIARDLVDADREFEAYHAKKAAEANPPKPKPKKEIGAPLQEHIDSGAIDLSLYESMTKDAPTGVPSISEKHATFGIAKLELGGIEEPGPDAWKGGDFVALYLFPHPAMKDVQRTLKKGEFLVDADGQAAAVVVQETTVYLGGCAFVAVHWVTDDPIARRCVRVIDAPWVGMAPPEGSPPAYLDARMAIDQLLVVDEKAGKIRPMYAEYIRSRLLSGPDYAVFFCQHIVRGPLLDEHHARGFNEAPPGRGPWRE